MSLCANSIDFFLKWPNLKDFIGNSLPCSFYSSENRRLFDKFVLFSLKMCISANTNVLKFFILFFKSFL